MSKTLESDGYYSPKLIDRQLGMQDNAVDQWPLGNPCFEV
jgi:hypothetical protein